MAEELLQIAESPVILNLFGLAQLGRLDARSRPSLLLNLVGSAILADYAVYRSQWGIHDHEEFHGHRLAVGLLRRPRPALSAYQVVVMVRPAGAVDVIPEGGTTTLICESTLLVSLKGLHVAT